MSDLVGRRFKIYVADGIAEYKIVAHEEPGTLVEGYHFPSGTCKVVLDNPPDDGGYEDEILGKVGFIAANIARRKVENAERIDLLFQERAERFRT